MRLLQLPLILLPLVAPLAGCTVPDFMSYPPQVRGNDVDADQIKQLVPGTSTRADVTALMGSPTAKASFDDNTWLYIGEVTKPEIGGTLKVLRQQVVVVAFDEKGVLTSISTKSDKDSLNVGMTAGATPSPGSDATFFQQLFGNVGRFTPLGGGVSAGGNNRSGGS